MDGDVVLLGCGSKSERMVLPNRHRRAAKEDVLRKNVSAHPTQVLRRLTTNLTSPGLGVLLLDLNLANSARVLDDLRHESLMPSPDFSCNSLSQVRESTEEPVLVEDTDAAAEGLNVGLNHAECTMDAPEHEEDDE